MEHFADRTAVVGGAVRGAAGEVGGGLARRLFDSWTAIIIVTLIVIAAYVLYFTPTWSMVDVSSGHFKHYVGIWYKYDGDDLKQLEILADRSIIIDDDRVVEMDNLAGNISGSRITFCGEMTPDILNKVTIDFADKGVMRNISITGLGTYYADKRCARANKS